MLASLFLVSCTVGIDQHASVKHTNLKSRTQGGAPRNARCALRVVLESCSRQNGSGDSVELLFLENIPNASVLAGQQKWHLKERRFSQLVGDTENLVPSKRPKKRQKTRGHEM